ncbi:hypothetical protein JDV09_24165 [Mycobacterium sp. Y57]|uniref:hypothetical protein n=1 Tax=Mycolicibacterium xanthum TaxID=2796469 RepID=UPI001C8554C2|nr:hypothetical protein [Mycolicibacterium xanthum]MBX7435170.1 hypothetical protein [Mycolicibacterium xanthum]
MNILQIPKNLRPRLTLVAMLALIVGMVAGCTGLGQEPGAGSSTLKPSPSSPFDPTTTAPEPTGPLLAYRAADEIGLVDGTTVIASAKGAFAPSNDLIATEDGRFVFARTTDNRLATIDVATRKGATRDIPVNSALGTSGQSVVVWWEQPNRLMRLDLADPDSRPELAQTVDLPPLAGIRPGEPRLLVARGGTAIIARVEAPPSPFGGPDTLYAVRGPGSPTPLGQADANSPVSVARLSPDGARLAYAVYRATDHACGSAAVVVTDADGSQQTYDAAGPDAQAGSRVPKLWWPATGLPKLSLMTWRCDRPETFPPLVWQLSDDSITQVSPPTSAVQTAELEAGQRALILPEDGAYTDPAGALVFEDGGRRITLKSGVDAIAVIEPAT